MYVRVTRAEKDTSGRRSPECVKLIENVPSCPLPTRCLCSYSVVVAIVVVVVVVVEAVVVGGGRGDRCGRCGCGRCGWWWRW